MGPWAQTGITASRAAMASFIESIVPSEREHGLEIGRRGLAAVLAHLEGLGVLHLASAILAVELHQRVAVGVGLRRVQRGTLLADLVAALLTAGLGRGEQALVAVGATFV